MGRGTARTVLGPPVPSGGRVGAGGGQAAVLRVEAAGAEREGGAKAGDALEAELGPAALGRRDGVGGGITSIVVDQQRADGAGHGRSRSAGLLRVGV